MKRRLFFLSALLFCVIFSCKKETIKSSDPGFTVYTIASGEHYSDKSAYKPITGLSSMKFVARFDSSAIYTTINPANQSDINKLYGFADNNATHHAFSARIGWRPIK